MNEFDRAKNKLKLYAERKDKKAAEKMMHSYSQFKKQKEHRLIQEAKAIESHKKLQLHREESFERTKKRLNEEIVEYNKIIALVTKALGLKSDPPAPKEPPKKVATPPKEPEKIPEVPPAKDPAPPIDKEIII